MYVWVSVCVCGWVCVLECVRISTSVSMRVCGSEECEVDDIEEVM